MRSGGRADWLPAGALRPFAILMAALLVAWVYAIIPNRSVWVYIFVKQELWSIFGVALYAEFAQLCMPDLPSSYYLFLYAVGIFIPMLVRSVAYLTNTWDDNAIQLGCTIVGLPVVVTLTTLHSYFNDTPVKPNSDRADENPAYWRFVEATHRNNSDAPADVAYFDLYSSTLSESFCQAAPSPSDMMEMSKGRRMWMSINSVDIRPSITQPLQVLRPSTLADEEALGSVATSALHSGAESTSKASDGPASLARVQGSAVRRPYSTWPRCMLLAFPKFYYQHCNIPLGFVAGSNRRQALFILLFFVASNGYFYLLMYFIRLFQRSKGDASSVGNMAFHFVLFIAAAGVVRLVLKRAGLALDRAKIGSTSMFFVAEFLGLMFFYTFYRLVFESVTSWGLFTAIQAVHLLWEWVSYPLRASRWLFPYLLYVQDHPRLPLLRNCFVPYDTNYQDWLDFFALDFGVRLVVMLSSAVGISLLLVTVQFVPWIDSDLREGRDADCLKSVQFILLATVLEAANAWIMNAVFFRRNNADVMSKTVQIFQDRRFATLSFIISVNLFINPIYAFTKDNHYHYGG